MTRTILTYLLAFIALSSIEAYASAEIEVTRAELDGSTWSYTIEFDQSMEGRTFYEHAGKGGSGSYLLSFSIKLGSGTKLVRSLRSEDEEYLYAQASKMDQWLTALKNGRLIPTGTGAGYCFLPFLTIRVNERPVQAIEKWFDSYQIVKCN